MDETGGWSAFDLNYLNHTTLLLFANHGVDVYYREDAMKLSFYNNEEILFDKNESGVHVDRFKGGIEFEKSRIYLPNTGRL